MAKPYKIGTVETLRVNSSGRRLYCNLDAFTVQAYGIQPGDILKVKIEEGFRPDNLGPGALGTGNVTPSDKSNIPEKEGRRGK